MMYKWGTGRDRMGRDMLLGAHQYQNTSYYKHLELPNQFAVNKFVEKWESLSGTTDVYFTVYLVLSESRY